MANTIDFNVNSNAVTVLNQTANAAENTAKGFTSAKAELRALNNQLLTMDQTSDAFKKASARAAELKDNISDLGAEINANAGNAFEGLSNNVGLFGSRLMSLDLKGAGQALSGMGAAVGKIDFKTLKEELGGLIQGFGNLAKSLLTNPILLLGAAVIASIVYFKELKTIFEDLTMNADKMNRRLLESQQVLEEIGKAKVVVENIKLLSKVVNDHTKSEEDRKKALDKLNVAFKANNIQTVSNITNTDALAKSTDNLIVKLVKEAEVRGKMAYLQELYAKKTKISAEAAQGSTNQALLILESMAKTTGTFSAQFGQGVVNLFSSTTLADMEEVNNQIKLVEENILSSSEAIGQIDISGAIPPPPPEPKKDNKKELDDYNKSQQELTEILAKWEQERLALEQKAREDYIHANQSAQANELYDLEQKKIKELELYTGSKEGEILILETYRLAEIDINTKYDDLALQQQTEANEKKKALDEKTKADDLARDKQLAADKLAAEQALMDAKFNLASASVNLLGTLFAKNKKAADIAFALDKALAIAQVVVNTQREISAYNANPVWSLSPDGGASIKIPAIIGAKLRAAASIAAIAGTAIGRFAGGGASGGSGAGATGGGGGTTAPSPANFAFLQNQPNQQPPLQAYVVGTQVSSNLEAQQLIQNQSRLGG
jgi:hypothetical protein